jgi:CAAX prenyl protease-like protein
VASVSRPVEAYYHGSLPRRPTTLAYIAPFLAFIGIMAVEKATGLSTAWLYPIRFLIVTGVLLAFSRAPLAVRPSRFWLSAALGAAVFALWIAPDVLFGPGYRHYWLFQNGVMGAPTSSIPTNLRHSVWFLVLRTASCTLLVPPVEELFWRGWLMRWIIDKEFLKVPLGTYSAAAFWMVAVTFASEHGPYWEVGLAAGIIYNWWIVRTHNLADCIVAHAVTNGLLSAYVLMTGQLQYWL